jgi:hypothetical protein
MQSRERGRYPVRRSSKKKISDAHGKTMSELIEEHKYARKTVGSLE